MLVGKQSYSGNVCTRTNVFALFGVEKQCNNFCWSINRMILLYLLLFSYIRFFFCIETDSETLFFSEVI